MSADWETGEGEAAERRAVVQCLVPLELAPRLHELLRDHFRDDPGVEVVVEQRGRERRRGGERRRRDAGARAGEERRRIHSSGGRRVGERRAPVSEAEPLALPRRARRYAAQLSFVERLEPSTQEAEDRDTARLVTVVQAGDQGALDTLYARYFGRVYSYLRVTVGDPHEAEDLTQEVFMRAIEALPGYELRPGHPFLAWLFRVARNAAIDALRRREHVELAEPNDLDREREGAAEEAEATLPWLSDRDVAFLVERLPDVQRQVLTMRYLLDLSTDDIAAVVDRTPKAVRQLQSRALRTLNERLTAMGRRDLRSRRARTVTRLKPLPVMVPRRFALTGPLRHDRPGT